MHKMSIERVFTSTELDAVVGGVVGSQGAGAIAEGLASEEGPTEDSHTLGEEPEGSVIAEPDVGVEVDVDDDAGAAAVADSDDGCADDGADGGGDDGADGGDGGDGGD